MTNLKPPTAESYWVATRVLAGKYPGAKTEAAARAKLDVLLAAGVTSFVDLTRERELVPYAHLLPDGVEHHRIPVPDVGLPRPEQVRHALRLIADGRGDGSVYVHCWGGCGRTGVIVGCLLVEHGLSGTEALRRVHQLTRAVQTKECPETEDQRAMVTQWTPPGAPGNDPSGSKSALAPIQVPTFKYVFQPAEEPQQWDLRGSPELWRYLAALLYQVPIPRDPAVALQLVKDTITNLTDWDCRSLDSEWFLVPLSLFQNGSGMSTGAAGTKWWAETGLPLIGRLIARQLDEYQELTLHGG
jgi:protein-tyrosine phosphatase